MNNKSKANFIIILLSFLILLIPSLLVAIGLCMFVGHFFAILLAAFGIFFIIGQISNIFAQKTAELNVVKLKTRLVEIATAQSAEVSCSYCKDRNVVPIRLNQRNTFECKACKQTNLIIFQFATAQISTPLELPQLGMQVIPNEQPKSTPIK